MRANRSLPSPHLRAPAEAVRSAKSIGEIVPPGTLTSPRRTPTKSYPGVPCFTESWRCMGDTNLRWERSATRDTDKMNFCEQYTRDENRSVFNDFRLLQSNSFNITLLLLSLTPVVSVGYM